MAASDRRVVNQPNHTLARILEAREDLLVETAANEKVAIDGFRRHLETLPRQTQLRNAATSLALDQDVDGAHFSFIEWLSRVARKLKLRNMGGLKARLAEISPNKAIGNIEGTSDEPYSYRVAGSESRDPWREVRVRTVKAVLACVEDDVVSEAQGEFPRRSFEEVLIYIENKVLASYRGVTMRQLVRPSAEIVAIAMSTNVEHVRVLTQTWRGSDGERPERHIGGGSWKEVIKQVSRIIRESDGRGTPVLVALNAPLGWPVPMIDALMKHHAGSQLPSLDIDAKDRGKEVELGHGYFEKEHESRWRKERNLFFRRETEQFVRSKGIGRWGDGRRAFGPSGLDVGADKSARTAHAALRLLKALRDRTNLEIPVITDHCGPIVQASAIEVHTSWRRTPTEDALEGKAPSVEDQGRQSEGIGAETPGSHERQEDDASAAARAAALDAVAFLEEDCDSPSDQNVPDEVARKEGWIWFSRKQTE